MYLRGYFISTLLPVSILFLLMITGPISVAQSQGLTGKVYLDQNRNGIRDTGDPLHPVIRVQLFADNDSSNSFTEGDELLGKSLTDAQGKFSFKEFKIPNEAPLIVAIDPLSLAPNHKLTQGHTQIHPDSIVEIVLGFQGEKVNCYSVGDGSSPDTLLIANRISGDNIPFGGDLGTHNIEAIAWNKGGTTLFGVNRKKLGKIDMKTGSFHAFKKELGVGNGANGPVTFDDADGLTFDPFTGKLYAVQRQRMKRDLLFQIDTLTGSFVPDAFGPGLDYTLIDGNGIMAEVDDIAINPIDGIMYGINNFGSVFAYELIIEIDKNTGKSTVIDTVKVASQKHPYPIYLNDIEGLSFTNTGQLLATTGTEAGEKHENTLFQLGLPKTLARPLGRLLKSRDFESCACLTGPINYVKGRVFEDLDINQRQSTKEEVGIRKMYVMIYSDNGDRHFGPDDQLVDSVLTDARGNFSWSTAGYNDFWIRPNLNTSRFEGYRFTQSELPFIEFKHGTGNQKSIEHTIGIAHHSYVNEWISFMAEEQMSQRKTSDPSARTRGISSNFFQIAHKPLETTSPTMGKKANTQSLSSSFTGYSLPSMHKVSLLSPNIYYMRIGVSSKNEMKTNYEEIGIPDVIGANISKRLMTLFSNKLPKELSARGSKKEHILIQFFDQGRSIERQAFYHP